MIGGGGANRFFLVLKKQVFYLTEFNKYPCIVNFHFLMTIVKKKNAT